VGPAPRLTDHPGGCPLHLGHAYDLGRISPSGGLCPGRGR
jgi:hypothetical protein